MASSGQVSIILKLVDKASRQMNDVSTASGRMAASFKKTGAAMTKSLTLPLLAVGVAGVKMASDLDTALRDVQSITGQTDAEIKQLSQDMIDLSTSMKTGAFTAVEYTRAQYDINSAAFEGADAMSILEISSKAASAGQAQLADAVSVTLNSLKAYNLGAEHTQRVNDLLFTGVRIGKQTYAELGRSVSGLAPTFAAFNIPIQDSIAAITLFRNKGTDAAEAVTQMKSIVLEMNSPTAELANLITKAGFASGRQMLATLGSTKALEELNRVSIAENVILSDTFANRRAQIGIMTLTGQNMNELMEIQGQLANSTGELDAAFAEQSKAFSFQLKKMMAAISEVLIIIGNELMPILVPIMEQISGLAKSFSKLPGPIKGVIVTIGLLVAAVGPLVWIVGTAISMWGAMTTGLAIFTGFVTATFIPTMLAMGAAVTFSLGPFGLIVIALAATLAAVVAFGAKFKAAVTFIIDAVRLIFTGDFLGGSLAGAHEDSPIVSMLLSIHRALEGFAPVLAIAATAFATFWLAVTGPIGLAVAAITGIILAVARFNPAIGGIISQLGVILRKGLGDVGKTFSVIVEQIITIIKKTIHNATKAFVQLGFILVTSLAKGIYNGAKAAIQAISDVGNAIIKGIKGILGIASPSKVMTAVGENIGTSIADGMSRTMPDINSMVGGAMGGMGGSSGGGGGGGISTSNLTSLFNKLKAAASQSSQMAQQIAQVLGGGGTGGAISGSPLDQLFKALQSGQISGAGIAALQGAIGGGGGGGISPLSANSANGGGGNVIHIGSITTAPGTTESQTREIMDTIAKKLKRQNGLSGGSISR